MLVKLNDLDNYVIDTSATKDPRVFRVTSDDSLSAVLPDEHDLYHVVGKRNHEYKLTFTYLERLQSTDYHLYKNLVHCLTTGTYFRNPRLASVCLNVSDTMFYNAAKKADGDIFTVRDLNFVVEDGVVTDDDLNFSGIYFATQMPKPIPSAKKSVVCKETGKVYDSIKSAASDLGITHGYLGQLIKRKKKYRGSTYEFVK